MRTRQAGSDSYNHRVLEMNRPQQVHECAMECAMALNNILPSVLDTIEGFDVLPQFKSLLEAYTKAVELDLLSVGSDIFASNTVEHGSILSTSYSRLIVQLCGESLEAIMRLVSKQPVPFHQYDPEVSEKELKSIGKLSRRKISEAAATVVDRDSLDKYQRRSVIEFELFLSKNQKEPEKAKATSATEWNWKAIQAAAQARFESEGGHDCDDFTKVAMVAESWFEATNISDEDDATRCAQHMLELELWIRSLNRTKDDRIIGFKVGFPPRPFLALFNEIADMFGHDIRVDRPFNADDIRTHAERLGFPYKPNHAVAICEEVESLVKKAKSQSIHEVVSHRLERLERKLFLEFVQHDEMSFDSMIDIDGAWTKSDVGYDNVESRLKAIRKKLPKDCYWFTISRPELSATWTKKPKG